MKKLMVLLFMFASSLSVAASVVVYQGMTVSTLRVWGDSGRMFINLTGPVLNPAGCPSADFYELAGSTEAIKDRIYSMALAAETTAEPVRVAIDSVACSLGGKSGYPMIWMMDLYQ